MKRPLTPLSLLDPSAALEEEGEREVTVTLRLTRDAVTVRAPVPIGPTRPLRFLPLLREITNAVVGRAEQASAKRGEPISCRAGCAACCRPIVPISETEAHFIRDLIEDLPPARRRVIEQRYAAARARLVEAGLIDRVLSPGPLTQDEFFELSLEYFALGIPCPFLEEESCSIYLERPLVCREFLVSSPNELCRDPRSEGLQRLLIEGDVSQALNRLQSDGKARGVHWVPLSLAPEWANEHPDLAPPEPASEMFSRVLQLVQDHAAVPEASTKKKKPGRK